MRLFNCVDVVPGRVYDDYIIEDIRGKKHKIDIVQLYKTLDSGDSRIINLKLGDTVNKAPCINVCDFAHAWGKDYREVLKLITKIDNLLPDIRYCGALRVGDQQFIPVSTLDYVGMGDGGYVGAIAISRLNKVQSYKGIIGVHASTLKSNLGSNRGCYRVIEEQFTTNLHRLNHLVGAIGTVEDFGSANYIELLDNKNNVYRLGSSIDIEDKMSYSLEHIGISSNQRVESLDLTGFVADLSLDNITQIQNIAYAICEDMANDRTYLFDELVAYVEFLNQGQV